MEPYEKQELANKIADSVYYKMETDQAFINTITNRLSSNIERRLDEYIIRKEAECNHHEKRTDSVYRTVYGNGRGGLEKQVSINTTKIKVAYYIGGFIIAAVATAVSKIIFD